MDDLEGNVQAPKRKMVRHVFSKLGTYYRSSGQLLTLPLKVTQSPALNSGPLLLWVTPLGNRPVNSPQIRLPHPFKDNRDGPQVSSGLGKDWYKVSEQLGAQAETPSAFSPDDITCVCDMNMLLKAFSCSLSKST